MTCCGETQNFVDTFYGRPLALPLTLPRRSAVFPRAFIPNKKFLFHLMAPPASKASPEKREGGGGKSDATRFTALRKD